MYRAKLEARARIFVCLLEGVEQLPTRTRAAGECGSCLPSMGCLHSVFRFAPVSAPVRDSSPRQAGSLSAVNASGVPRTSGDAVLVTDDETSRFFCFSRAAHARVLTLSPHRWISAHAGRCGCVWSATDAARRRCAAITTNLLRPSLRRPTWQSKSARQARNSSIRLERLVESVGLRCAHTHTGSLFARQYEVLEKLGVGSYGKVKKCRDINTGRAYALKIFNRLALRKPRMNAERTTALDDVLREIRIMVSSHTYACIKSCVLRGRRLIMVSNDWS